MESIGRGVLRVLSVSVLGQRVRRMRENVEASVRREG